MDNHLKKLCRNEDYVNYSRPLGVGTHGFVYERLRYPELAIKIFQNDAKLDRCSNLKSNEYSIQEYVSNNLPYELSNFGLSELIEAPKVYGFKYLPTSEIALCCSYEMERLFPLPGFNQLIQLTLSFHPDYAEAMSQGYFVGIKVLSAILKSQGLPDLYSIIIRSIGIIYAIFHFKWGLDANDIEFVLGTNSQRGLKMFVIDFDKVSRLPTTFPSSLRVKLTESDYQDKQFTQSDQLYRHLATTIHMFPPIEKTEFQIAADGYQSAAKFYQKSEEGLKVMEYYSLTH